MPSRRTSAALAAAPAHVEPNDARADAGTATTATTAASAADATVESRRRRREGVVLLRAVARSRSLSPARVPAKASAGDDELPFTD